MRHHGIYDSTLRADEAGCVQRISGFDVATSGNQCHEGKSRVSMEADTRGRLEGEVESLRERLRSDEINMLTRMKGAETYHSSVVSNKDAQIQALRSQVEGISESRSREGWLQTARISAKNEVDAAKLAVDREACEQILDNENRARSEIEEVRRQLHREEASSLKLKEEVARAKKSGARDGRATGGDAAEKSGRARPKNQFSSLQHQLTSMRDLQLKEAGAKEAFMKAKKAEAIIQQGGEQ